MKNALKAITALALSAAFVFMFAACNKNTETTVTFSDVYKQNTSVGEFTSVKAEMILPSGWSVFTTASSNYSSSSGTDSGYIKELDAFVITNGTILSVMKCGASEMMFPSSSAITALNVSKGLIVIKSADGTMSVYNSNGRLKISRTNITGTGTNAIGTVVKVLTSELVAVKSTYDVHGGGTNYTSIYRVSTGAVACRVKNQGGTVTNLEGFDNDYVVCTGTAESSTDVARIFKIPSVGGLNNFDGTQLGYFADNGEDDYYIEITYMGSGRFFVHEDWTVGSDEEYSYHYNDEYVSVSRHIYDAASDRLSVYTSDYYFLNLTNKYYGNSRTGLSASSFLNDGYYYASYCMTVDDDKEGYYDQFILNSDLDVVMSLTGNFGININKFDAVDSVSYFDLALFYSDGVGIVPVLTSKMRAYDTNGNLLFENSDYSITTAGYNNGIIVATTVKSDTTYYGGFDTTGKLVIPFNYTKIDPFTGYYTIAERADENGKTVRVLLSKDGVELQAMSDFSVPLADIATTSSGTPIYKVGCYMSTETRDGVLYYGVKNLDANRAVSTLISNTMVTGSILYAPSASPSNVFVFAKFSDTDNFTIYRLI